MSSDMVNHPTHYNSHPSGVEAIEIVEHMNFCMGNAFKYVYRFQLKNGLQDLEKAHWYLKRQLINPLIECFIKPDVIADKFKKIKEVESNKLISDVLENIYKYSFENNSVDYLHKSMDLLNKLIEKEKNV